MADPRTIRVLIADNDADVRRDLRARLGDQDASTLAKIVVVADAPTADSVVSLASGLRPDVVILGVGLPGIGSATAARRIRAAGAAAGVLVLTASEHDPRLLEILREGVSGHLRYDASAADLESAVRAAARGTWTATPRLQPWPAEPRQDQPTASPLDSLTPRERDILRLVAGGRTNKQIATTVDMPTAAVKKAVAEVLRKLHVNDRAEAAALATTHGLR